MSDNRIESLFVWLGGGERRELDERHERSTHAVVGAVVLLGAVLAWLVLALALTGSTQWPAAVVVALTSVFGLLVGAVSRAISSGPTRWQGVLGRGVVGLALGLVVGELAAVVLFSGAVDRRLSEQALARADAAPAVVEASTELQRSRAARAQLDDAVTRAIGLRDEALVVARCEFKPSPTCPQTRITGVPGAGPENRTANDFLADTQRQLDAAVGERDRRAPALDAQIADGERAVAQARGSAVADVDGGLGARWAAMNDHTLASAGTVVLRALTVAFFVLLYLLPLILKLWRGETTLDRGAAARAERERAEMQADTAIAVKRAEVRAAVETMWAEQQLESAKLAIAAQNEIDREQQRRRVVEAIDAPVHVQAERVSEQVAELPAGGDNLPARVDPAAVQQRSLLPDVTKAATRWIRPFVPPIVASAVETAVDTAAKPLRGVRQIFEEEEEIHFSLRRTHKVTVQSEEGDDEQIAPRAPMSTVVSERRDHLEAETERTAVGSGETQRQLPSGE